MHVGARYYDAQVGLFITRDIYLEQKPYLYCEHDPVNRVDPTGHEWDFWGWLGRTLELDFNFSRDDIREIGKQIEENGRIIGEIGVIIGTGGLVQPSDPRDSVWPFPPRKYTKTIPGYPRPVKMWRWAKPGGYAGYIGGGMAAGGGIAVLIGKWWQWLADH